VIVLIVGLPGAGKTSLAQELVSRTGAIHLNADAVRADLNSDLGFTTTDRLEQARRMGSMARLLSAQGFLVIVDFVCPTKETRKMFGKADFTFWVSRIEEGRYENTNRMWEDLSEDEYDLKINKGLTVKQDTNNAHAWPLSTMAFWPQSFIRRSKKAWQSCCYWSTRYWRDV
jgi:translation elongation factor EF-G